MNNQALDGEQILQNVINQIFSPLYQLAVACALIYFLYGVLKFIHDLKNPEAKNTGKEHLLWGLIGLFIIFSVGGILSFFNSTLGGMFTN